MRTGYKVTVKCYGHFSGDLPKLPEGIFQIKSRDILGFKLVERV